MKLVYPDDSSSASLRKLVRDADSDIVFIGDPRLRIEPGPRMFERMTQVMRETGAGWVYSDSVGHPRIDYQLGSIRDNFDFGAVVAIRTGAVLDRTESQWGALYDLRLRISEKYPIARIPEPLYAASIAD